MPARPCHDMSLSWGRSLGGRFLSLTILDDNINWTLGFYYVSKISRSISRALLLLDNGGSEQMKY